MARLACAVDRWAGRALFDTPTDRDPRVLAKREEMLLVSNQQGRKFWALGIWTMSIAAVGFMDPIIMGLAGFIVPCALLTRPGPAFDKYGRFVHHMLLALFVTRMIVPNNANPEARAVAGGEDVKLFNWLTFILVWDEVSVQLLSELLCKHMAVHVAVVLLVDARGLLWSLVYSTVMLGVFCYRRRWDRNVTDALERAIAADQLVHSKQEARFFKDLSDSKSVFLRTLCHELRNPMTAVQGNNELLVRKLERFTHQRESELGGLKRALAQLGGEHSKLMNNVLTELPKMLQLSSNALLSSRHMSDVVNQTLTTVQMDSQSGIVAPEEDETEFSPGEVVETVLRMFDIVAQRKGVELRLEMPPGEERVRVCARQTCLKQIVINLLGNSLKFTQCGSIVLHLSITSTSRTHARLECSIADTGIGMSPQELEHLFVPFSQANPGIKARYGGSGLGLHIVHTSLQHLGGVIRVESAKHQGSTFTFELPVALISAADEPELSPRRMTTGTQQLSVMVTDDDASVREVLQQQLSLLFECAVTCATNGKEAMFLAEEQRFDLILMDVNMPVLGGLDATRAIRAGSTLNARTPIVGLSGNSLDADVELAIGAGMTAYLTKPYKLAMLQETISRYADTSWKQGICQPAPAEATLPPERSAGARAVLVVDDDVLVREVLVELISLLEPSVLITQADDGFQAIERSAEAAFDLILVDYHMPGLDGLQASERIRAGGGLNKDTPIVLVSGSSQAELEESRLTAQLGRMGCLSKPYSMGDVESMLSKYGVLG